MSNLTNLSPHQAAAFWQLKLLNADDVEALATSWLEAGLNAPELAVIAGSQRPTLREIGDDFAAAMSTLTGEDQPSHNEAGRIALAYYLEEMISGAMKPFEASRAIINELQHLDVKLFQKTNYAGSELGIEKLLGLYYAIDNYYSASAEKVSLIENELIAEAKNLLARITSTNNYKPI